MASQLPDGGWKAVPPGSWHTDSRDRQSSVVDHSPLLLTKWVGCHLPPLRYSSLAHPGQPVFPTTLSLVGTLLSSLEKE